MEPRFSHFFNVNFTINERTATQTRAGLGNGPHTHTYAHTQFHIFPSRNLVDSLQIAAHQRPSYVTFAVPYIVCLALAERARLRVANLRRVNKDCTPFFSYPAMGGARTFLCKVSRSSLF